MVRNIRAFHRSYTRIQLVPSLMTTSASRNDQEDASPYQAPMADLNRAGAADRPPRPSIGDVAMLMFLQVAFSASLGLGLWVVYDRSWAGYPLVGIMGGAIVFAELRNRYQQGSCAFVYRLHLAIWSGLLGTVLCACLSPGARKSLRAIEHWWLAVVSGSLAMGIITFAPSLAGLWLGTRSLVTLLRRWYGVN
jgi:hypothetical protein